MLSLVFSLICCRVPDSKARSSSCVVSVQWILLHLCVVVVIIIQPPVVGLTLVYTWFGTELEWLSSNLKEGRSSVAVRLTAFKCVFAKYR